MTSIQDFRASGIAVRRADFIDVDAIMRIIACAQRRMAEIGIDQWQDGYPDRAQIERDIQGGIGTVFTKEDVPIGYGALLIGREPAYDALRGAWLQSDKRYATIHRTALADGCNGHGLGGDMIAFFINMARTAGCASVRIDTHRGNFPMRHVLDRLGFVLCGEVEYECAGDPIRAAYEYILEEK